MADLPEVSTWRLDLTGEIEPDPRVEAFLVSVSELMLQHKSGTVIARELDVKYELAKKAMAEVRRRWQIRTITNYDDMVAEQIKRYDRVEESLWQRAVAGDLGVVDRLIALWDQRNRVMGLYAPKTVDITVRIRDMALRYGLDPDEAVREASKFLKSGAIEG